MEEHSEVRIGALGEAPDQFVQSASRRAVATSAALLGASGLGWVLLNVTCSGGLECVPWLVPIGISLFAGAPTTALFFPPLEYSLPWLGVVLGVITSLPGWWWTGGRLARRALRERPEHAWRTWTRHLAATMGAAAVVAIAVVYLLGMALYGN